MNASLHLIMYHSPTNHPLTTKQPPTHQVPTAPSSATVRFAKRLLAVANPEALASAEAHQDPLAALAFLCPEEGSILEAGAGRGSRRNPCR